MLDLFELIVGGRVGDVELVVGLGGLVLLDVKVLEGLHARVFLVLGRELIREVDHALVVVPVLLVRFLNGRKSGVLANFCGDTKMHEYSY